MAVFTDRFIKAADLPDKGRKIVFDAHKSAPTGFGLRVTAAGKKSFILRYNATGKDRLLTIGDYPTWTLAAARTQAAKFRQDVDSGIDILQARRDKRNEATVADVVERYCTGYCDRLQSGPSIRGAFAKHVIPAIGGKKLADVRRGDVFELVERLAAKHPRQAAKLLGYIKRMFVWAEDKGIIEGNPTVTLKPRNINEAMKPRIRARVLTDAEIRQLWNDARGMSRPMWCALRFVLLTGQRPGEVLQAEKSEVRGKIWTIPAAHRGKTRTDHAVPLTKTARALIKEAGGEQFLFEYDGAAMTTPAMARAVSRRKYFLSDDPEAPWRPHDLRRTMRTRLAKAKIPPHIAELAVGHTKKGIVAVYDQARYADEIRHAMETWERSLLRIVTGNVDNVVSIRGAA